MRTDSDYVDTEDTLTGLESDEYADNLDSSTSKEASCECQCCAYPGTPYQPLNVSESSTTHSHFCKERQHGQLKIILKKNTA